MEQKKMSRVAVVPCEQYEEASVYEAVKEGLSLLGGCESWFSKEEQILLKPNLLRRAESAQAITTHPMVVKAVGRCFREAGFIRLSYGDSPGGTVSCKKAAESCGIFDAAAAEGIPQADFETTRKVPFPEGQFAKEFIVCEAALQADAIVNICKMKTHALERITGAVKNLYGVIPGITKGVGHVKYPDPDSFAGMLSDLHRVLKPRLHIMDAITAMEGNGPASGTPFAMGLMLFSADAVALDSVFCRLVHLDPEIVPTNRLGQQAGIGTWRSDCIEIVTPDGSMGMEELAERFGHPEFEVLRDKDKRGSLKPVNFFLKRLENRPVIKKENCVKCGICVDSCPLTPKALSMDSSKKKPPKYDYNCCIRCYCCQEMCPKKAIEVRRPLIGKLFSRKM